MKILFVCYGNAYRSPLAEALLKKLRPDINIESAGIRTSIPIGEEIKRYLEIQGALHLLKKTPQNLSQKNLNTFDLIITMQNIHTKTVLKKCPDCRNKVIEWNVEDPYFMEREKAREVYEKINIKVKKLAKSL
jgi:protein-tyrosine phosphatase